MLGTGRTKHEGNAGGGGTWNQWGSAAAMEAWGGAPPPGRWMALGLGRWRQCIHHTASPHVGVRYTAEAVERGSEGGRRYAPVFVRITCKPPKIFRATREKEATSVTFPVESALRAEREVLTSVRDWGVFFQCRTLGQL